MSDDQAQLQKLIEEAQRLNERLGQSAHGNGGSATISVDAGGFGLWLSTTLCAVMFAINVILIVTITRQDRLISDHGHQLNAIYMMAPHLKPEPRK